MATKYEIIRNYENEKSTMKQTYIITGAALLIIIGIAAGGRTGAKVLSETPEADEVEAQAAPALARESEALATKGEAEAAAEASGGSATAAALTPNEQFLELLIPVAARRTAQEAMARTSPLGLLFEAAER